MIERFAGYGFNKAHSAAYAVIAAQTAYLKAHYPVEFMAALLSADIGNDRQDRLRRLRVPAGRDRGAAAGYQSQCPGLLGRALEDGSEAVRFGLGAVRNVGEGAIQSILDCASRPARRPIRQSGCALLGTRLEGGDPPRRSRVWRGQARSISSAIGGRCSPISIARSRPVRTSTVRGRAGRSACSAAKDPLAGSVSSGPGGPPLDPASCWRLEKEALGLYLSAHPLTDSSRADCLRICRNHWSRRSAGWAVGPVDLLDQIVRRITTAPNKIMAVVELEDLTGRIELVLFPEVYEEFGPPCWSRMPCRDHGQGSIAGRPTPVHRRADLVRDLRSFEPAPPPPNRAQSAAIRGLLAGR